MNLKKYILVLILMASSSVKLQAQELAYLSNNHQTFRQARSAALIGKHKDARIFAEGILEKNSGDHGARLLLARTLSFEGKHEQARKEFNAITSKDKTDRGAWISAVKNELYANNGSTALGLANKALLYVQGDEELQRLRQRAITTIENTVYPPLEPPVGIGERKKSKTVAEKAADKEAVGKKKEEETKNAISIRNGFTIFNEFYDPNVVSSVEYRRRTKYGTILPRINYSNRFETNGLQYDIDLYPKFSKTFYAYINYGYSRASIFPNHKVGGDLYANLPWAMEVSAGARYLSFDNRDISIISNSVGYYKGNYYFSLRSYITPRPNSLTRVSGNLLIRRYFRDAENYFGLSMGMGYTPDIRQVILDGTVLSETRLFLESQRINFEYQFSAKKTPNVYQTRIGLARQELFSEPGNFIWSLNAGFIYRVKF